MIRYKIEQKESVRAYVYCVWVFLIVNRRGGHEIAVTAHVKCTATSWYQEERERETKK